MAKYKRKRLLTECLVCGTPFLFECVGETQEKLEAHLDWAMKSVLYCAEHRPHKVFRSVFDHRPGIGGTDYI